MRDGKEEVDASHNPLHPVEYLRNGRSVGAVHSSCLLLGSSSGGAQRRGTVLVHYQWALIPAAASHYRVAR